MGITIRITSEDTVIRIEKNHLYGDGFVVSRIFGSDDILISGSKDKFNKCSYTWDESLDVDRIEVSSTSKVFIKEGALNPKLDFTAVACSQSVVDIGNNCVNSLYVYASGEALVKNARVNFYLFCLSFGAAAENIMNNKREVGVKSATSETRTIGKLNTVHG